MASKEDKNKDASGGSSSNNERPAEKPEPTENIMDRIANFFADKLHLSSTSEDDDTDGRQVLQSVDIPGVVSAFKAGKFKKIVTMVGAGISTSAGIPDFRSPSSGLYHNLQKFNLPYPEAIFELDYFRENPQPFFKLAKELYPGTFKPTPSHYFVKALQDKGLLLRHYTQNIDTLERIAGIDDEKLVEAHGTFYVNHCVDCNEEYSMEWAKKAIFADNVPTCTKCNGIVKPDIVFFGENLPERFYVLPHRDFKQCDLLIIMGTSLTVQPFASLVDYVSDHCVRLLINRDKVGKNSSGFLRSMIFGEGLCFDLPGNRRDVAYEGDCDEGCLHLADQFGFGDELREMVKNEHARIDLESGKCEASVDAEAEKEIGEEEASKEKLLKNDVKNEKSTKTNDKA
ncbi:CLUMA_CG018884, isoform A [Clunio marinus]|uniref:NAD-dependent protein deacetylase n=1 Tax=Clunio marinus TaxID=568069 RepID=A0A1J1J3J6_9DIPT|nr:CLUMA_CG018884, isoform A [Clunio marinus]